MFVKEFHVIYFAVYTFFSSKINYCLEFGFHCKDFFFLLFKKNAKNSFDL